MRIRIVVVVVLGTVATASVLDDSLTVWADTSAVLLSLNSEAGNLLLDCWKASSSVGDNGLSCWASASTSVTICILS